MIELEGVTEVTFSWQNATGPVSGYVVYVSVNGEEPLAQATVGTVSVATVAGSVGDYLKVRVAAIDAEWNEGPISEYSEEVVFTAAPDPDPGPPPTDDPPADDPPGEDPPTDEPPGEDPPTDEPPADDLPPEETSATPLDFDGDGFADLLLRHSDTGEMRIWLMEGGYLLRETALPNLPLGWSIVGNGDYDGDGQADVLSREDATGRLDIWLIDGGTVVQDGTILDSLGSGWKVVSSADHDGNGRGDVLLHNSALGLLDVIFVDGTEVLSRSELSSEILAESEVIGSGDYDGDGQADLLWQTPDGIYVWRIGPLMGIEVVRLTKRQYRWNVIGSGDYDGDGDSDLLVERNGKLGVSLIDGLAMSDLVVITSKKSHLGPATGVGDCDGDGAIDLMLRNKRTGARVIHFMSGVQVQDTAPVPDLARGWTFANVGERPAAR